MDTASLNKYIYVKYINKGGCKTTSDLRPYRVRICACVWQYFHSKFN